MTDAEVIDYLKQLQAIGFNPPLSFSSARRQFNPNLSLLINPNPIDQLDLFPHNPSCEIWLPLDDWQFDVEHASNVVKIANSKWNSPNHYAVKIQAEVGNVDKTMFLGALRFKNNVGTVRVAVWYSPIAYPPTRPM